MNKDDTIQRHKALAYLLTKWVLFKPWGMASSPPQINSLQSLVHSSKSIPLPRINLEFLIGYDLTLTELPVSALQQLD